LIIVDSVRVSPHGPILWIAACAALAVTLSSAPAEAKPSPRALITPHHAQSKLVRIPKVRRVRHPLSYRLPLALPAKGRGHGSGAVEINPPILEELEIECVLADAVADDPSRRVAVVRPVVRSPLILEEVEDGPPPAASQGEADRPPPAKALVRLHPRHLVSGDDDAHAIA
jgi:hypothetical protein